MATEKDSYDKILADIKNDKTLDEKTKLNILNTVLNGRWFSRGLDTELNNMQGWVQVK